MCRNVWSLWLIMIFESKGLKVEPSQAGKNPERPPSPEASTFSHYLGLSHTLLPALIPLSHHIPGDGESSALPETRSSTESPSLNWGEDFLLHQRPHRSTGRLPAYNNSQITTRSESPHFTREQTASKKPMWNKSEDQRWNKNSGRKHSSNKDNLRICL